MQELGDGKADELVADEHEASGHENGVGCEGMAHETSSPAPEPHEDEDHAEREKLSDFYAHVECEEIGNEAIFRDIELDNFRRQTEAMKEAED